MKLKPFACSISVIRWNWIEHAPFVVWATSKTKAHALALDEARARWPAAHAHKALVIAVPPNPPE